jgi:acetylserotonin O-methyltransferase
MLSQSQPESPSPLPIIELMEAFRRSKTMFVALSVGVFDLLERAPANLASMARELELQSGPLERLLDACVGLGLLRKEGSRYANQAVASAYLCRNKEGSLAGYILYSDQVLFPLWTHLEDAIREGTPRWAQAFGIEGGIFDHFFRISKECTGWES